MTTRKAIKGEIITFKVDAPLQQALQGVENRSEFIRAAILQALDNGCPLCGGAGTLTPAQKNHWERFMRHHELKECARCHERMVVCKNQPAKPRAAPSGRRRA